MNFILSAVLGLVFIVLQTACVPALIGAASYFDLLLPLVIYLCISSPPVESIPLILIFGILTGALSGGPFGLYLIVYMWLYIGVRVSMRFLDAGSYFLFPLILVAGVVFENLLFSVAATGGLSARILWGALWALVTAPFFLLFFNALFDKFRRIAARIEFYRQG